MKETFKRLPEDKQEFILGAFLAEFAKNDYENASISAVVKSLGIAKGSIYQYFGSKMELYKGLVEVCTAEKMKYVEGVNQDDFWDFWDYYRELYVQGFKFDLERPQHSQFLFRVSQDRSNPIMEEMQKENYLKSLLYFNELVEKQMESGTISKDYDPQFVAQTIISQANGLREYLLYIIEMDAQGSIEENNTVFAQEQDRILKYVDQSIGFMKKAFG